MKAKKRRVRQAEPCELMKTIGANVKDYRVQSWGWTQEELAKTSGMSIAMLSCAERGTRSVSIDNLERLAKALGITAAELCGGRP